MNPGKSSTEFFVFLALAALTVANGTEYVNIDSETMRWFLGFGATYIGSRTAVKWSNKKHLGEYLGNNKSERESR